MEQASKLASTFQSDALIDNALEDGGSFTVQRALLCGGAEYFRSALLGNFAEASEKKLRLPGCDTQTFELLLYWICKKELPTPPYAKVKVAGEEDEDEDEADHDCDASCGALHAALVRLWHTAGMYIMPELQNATMRCLLDKLLNCFVGQLAIELAFKMGDSQCLMRKVLLEELVAEFLYLPEPSREKTELDEIASIPDLFAAFTATMQKHGFSKTEDGMGMPARMDRSLQSKYMVPIL